MKEWDFFVLQTKNPLNERVGFFCPANKKSVKKNFLTDFLYNLVFLLLTHFCFQQFSILFSLF
jgi:hypothetical protein